MTLLVECDTSRRLPCGCVRGFELCVAAQQLWESANATYRAATSGGAHFSDYDRALAAYEAHFEVPR